ncbi:MFS transporter [Ihubacter sp. mB4P-1]|uniref:MFS transporter n=1 Tax=Ihubacter sp. mB4P-1 TaxID=3242370 RepID=UPI0013799DC9
MRNNVEIHKFKGLYFLTYAALGVLVPLIGQYLSSIGFSGTQIGIVTSVGTAVAIFAATFWGKIYSNSADGRKVVALLCAAAALMGVVNTFVTEFMVFVITYGIMYFFQGPVNGLTDAMVLEHNQGSFAQIRLFGAVGYAITVFTGGRIGAAFGLQKIFYIYAVAFLFGAMVVMRIRQRASGKDSYDAKGTKGRTLKKGKETISFSELLCDKKSIQLIICGIFVMGTNVANNTYFSFLFRDGGGTVAGVGTVFLLMVGSEAPFMALAPWITKRFSQEKIIVSAMILSAVRFSWYATGPSWQMLMALFFLQGMVNGILLVEYVKYLSAVVESKLIGIAVSAFYAVSSNGGSILCNFLGGIAMDHFGSVGVYGLFGIFNAIGVALYFLWGLHKKKD